MNLYESKGSRTPLRASEGVCCVKKLTDSFGLDSILLSLYVQKINIPVGASVWVRSPEWCSEFLKRSTKPHAKYRSVTGEGYPCWRSFVIYHTIMRRRMGGKAP